MKVLFHVNNIIQFLQSLIFWFEFLICSRLWNKSLNIFGFFRSRGVQFTLIYKWNLICTFILDAMIFDPETSTFSSVGATNCSHKGSGCALFYSPMHKNRPTIFIGGSNDTSFDNCAEILDYTLNNNTWEKRMYRSYKMVFYYILSKITIKVVIIISSDCL